MIVSCEKCTKRYYLDEEALGSQGKNVRCTACNHIWYQKTLMTQNPLMVLPNVYEGSLKTKKNKALFYLKYACISSSGIFLILSVWAVFSNKNIEYAPFKTEKTSTKVISLNS